MYEMYVSDSLFYIQHLLGNDGEDRHPIFSMKYRELIESLESPTEQENADDIINRMIEKSEDMTKNGV